MSTIRPDPEEIKRSIGLFLPTGGVIELRVPNAGRDFTISGYFSDPDKLLKAAMAVDGKAPGVYVTINPVLPALFARSANAVKPRAKSTTADSDVVRRQWLLLDFDPDIPAGISSTDEEHQATLDAALTARDYFLERGWPRPLVGDSGNGSHLLYRVDLPNDEPTKILVSNMLKAGAKCFAVSGKVKFDVMVFNAGRISKLYGTTVRKGDSTDDRPHRLSRIIEMPGDGFLSLEMVEIMAAAGAEPAKPTQPNQPKSQTFTKEFDLENWFAEHGVPIRSGPIQDKGYEKWILQACPFYPEHTGKDAAIMRSTEGTLYFKCFHDHCAGKLWTDFRAFYEPNRAIYQKPFAVKPNGYASTASVAASARAPELSPDPDAPPAEPAPDFTAQLALRVTEIVAAKDLTDATGTYSPTFFALCVQAGHVAAFNARQALKKAFGKDLVLKGVPGAWDNRYQAAVDQSRRQSTSPHEPSWRDQMILTDKGGIAACYENAALAAENSPEWNSVLGYNEFTGGHVVLEAGPYPLTAKPGEEIEDHFDTEVTRWFERQGVMVKPEVARRTVDRMARMNVFHPVRDYLNGLPAWDQVPRAADWLIKYCAVAPIVKNDSDEEVQNLFAMDIGQRFLISAVARIFEPGCKADHVLMLEGKTSIGKSTLCEVLAGKDFFTDQLSDLGSKDASMQVRGIWMAELADIHALSRSDRERAKAFFTQRFERFRLPYGKRLVKFQRQCVFIGTTESSEWNTDERGARRFWPVLCEGKIDIEGVIRDRDQLWAEALYQYRRHHKWHIVKPDILAAAEQIQASRFAVDVWQESVIIHATDIAGSVLAAGKGASISDILTRLKVPIERQDRVQANRVGACLRFSKWQRHQVRVGEVRQWRYFPPDPTTT